MRTTRQRGLTSSVVTLMLMLAMTAGVEAVDGNPADAPYPQHLLQIDGRYAYLSAAGEVATPWFDGFVFNPDERDDVLIVSIDGLFGLRTALTGEWLIEPTYNHLYRRPRDGFVGVLNLGVEDNAFVLHVLGADGSAQKEQEHARRFAGYDEDAVMVEDKDGRLGMIDIDKGLLVDGFEILRQFENGYATGVKEIDGEHVSIVIDRHGREVLRTGSLLMGNPTYGLVRYKDGPEAFGFLDLNGAVVIRPAFPFVNDFHEGLAAVRVPTAGGVAWRYITLTGEFAFEQSFRSATDFREGFAAVAVDDDSEIKWSVIDVSGRMIVEPKYLWCEPMRNGVIFALDESSVGFLDRTGRWFYREGRAE